MLVQREERLWRWGCGQGRVEIRSGGSQGKNEIASRAMVGIELDRYSNDLLSEAFVDHFIPLPFHISFPFQMLMNGNL